MLKICKCNLGLNTFHKRQLITRVCQSVLLISFVSLESYDINKWYLEKIYRIIVLGTFTKILYLESRKI